MPGSDRQSWNQRYLAGEFGLREPDPFVMETHRNYLEPLLLPSAAPEAHTGLDLAGGAGHHAIWLAQQAWRMTLADWSETALEIAKEKSAANSLPLEIMQGPALDVVTQSAQQGRRFGFVLVSFFLDRAVLPWLPKILIPGGILLYRTYTEDNERLGNPRGPRNPEHLLHSQ
ncbi:MAG: class I SAM-dependent methyltransferase, partial [Acidobacteriaceae bacterium]